MLEYDQAIADFTSAADQNPTDPNAWNHLAQGILFRAMYRSGALESEMVSGSNPFVRRAKVRIPAADDIGFFDLSGGPRGSVRLRCDPPTGRLITDWVCL